MIARIFIQYSNDMDDVYKNVEKCNPALLYITKTGNDASVTETELLLSTFP